MPHTSLLTMFGMRFTCNVNINNYAVSLLSFVTLAMPLVPRLSHSSRDLEAAAPAIIATHSVTGAFAVHHFSQVFTKVVFGVLSVTALVGLLLVDNLVLVAVCGWGELGVALCQAGVVVVGATAAHVAELCAARPLAPPQPPSPQLSPLPNHG